MSDSLMPFQPAIEEPSNILPSVKKSRHPRLGRDGDVLLLALGVCKTRAPILGDKDEPNRISTRPKADNMCTTMELAPVFCTFIVRSLLAQAQPMRLGARINPRLQG
jgi:hypothetical protein